MSEPLDPARPSVRRNVFITGGTGYIGSYLIRELLRRGHTVRGLFRPGSKSKMPDGVEAVWGEATERNSFASKVRPSDVFVHLAGVAHPNPLKAKQFKTVDLASARAGVSAAVEAGVAHFVYVSIAHPAPIMQSYINARIQSEGILRSSGLPATIVRPWYVLGPGRRWPAIALPLYWLLRLIPSGRPLVERLSYVTIAQMTAALLHAVENPPVGVRVVEVADIRKA